jgi:uncharacterized membrane protein
VTFSFYYLFSRYFGGPGNLVEKVTYMEPRTDFLDPSLIFFWPAPVVLLIFTKLFPKGTVVTGAVVAELVLHLGYAMSGTSATISVPLVLATAVLVLIYGWPEYIAGLYSRPEKTIRDLYRLIGGIFGSFLVLAFSWQVPFFFSLVYLASMIPSCLVLVPLAVYALDQWLWRYRPLSPEEEEALGDYEHPEEFPRPGELYHEVLTHHWLYEDDHTVVFVVGGVRLYACTRCTATLFGFLLCGVALSVTSHLRVEFPSWIALTLLVGAPIVSLLDWGTQAMGWRKSQTKYRFSTGMVLGGGIFSIQLLRQQFSLVIVVIVVSFVIFGLLMIKRGKTKMEDYREHMDAMLESDYEESDHLPQDEI